VLVQSTSRDPVEALNSLLRNSGLAVYCTWIPALADIGEALEQLNPELLLSFNPDDRELIELASIRDQVAPSVPLLAMRDTLDEAVIAADMARGARDTLSLRQPERVQSVVRRELRSFRMERTLTSTLNAAHDYRHQLETVLRRSKDAIAQVQEGIIVDANASWLELFGFADASAIVGQPIMDLFDAETQAPLRGALAACLKGRWSDHILKTGAVLADNSVVPLEIVLGLGEHEGEPSVQLIVPAQHRDEKQMARDLQAAVHQDPATSLWTRRRLLQLVREQLATPLPGGARFLACIAVDKYADIEKAIGLQAGDDLLAQFALVVRSLVGQHDVLGHLSDASLLLLAQRGNARDMEAWCESLIERVARHAFGVGSASLHATCSVGLTPVPAQGAEFDQLAQAALDATRRSRERGGNQLESCASYDHDTRVQAYDEVWVRHIKAALMENRFRLVQQPIASLNGSSQKIFDAAVRMLDLQGKEVLPSEFLPAAARNDLMRNIDRWVLGASLSFIAKRSPDLLFVRMSRDSIADGGFISWLDTQLRSTLAEPQRLCLQFTEEDTARLLHPSQLLFSQLRQRRVRVALEHFGTGRDPLALIGLLPLDFLKIDGSLMQGLGGSPEQQQRIRAIAAAANANGVQTVAERIEDANTMAVVWQLGVQYIQGYLVHAPEEVVLKS
jgi:diguanylate cyclase (GGDEF)-like protein